MEGEREAQGERRRGDGWKRDGKSADEKDRMDWRKGKISWQRRIKGGRDAGEGKKRGRSIVR